jgi:hypothetical protein
MIDIVKRMSGMNHRKKKNVNKPEENEGGDFFHQIIANP